MPLQVDTTLSKGVLRILTTIAGGVLGYLVMLDRDVATNPYGLMAICCALTFLCGLLALSGLKYAIFLLLITCAPFPLLLLVPHTTLQGEHCTCGVEVLGERGGGVK